MKHHNKFSNLVTKTKDHIQTMDVYAVHEMQATDTPYVLIDVREASEWKKGCIPGAIHLSKGVLERDIESRVPNVETTLILYCGGGSRSVLAARNLKDMGYTHVISMDGGFSGWKQAGFDVATPK